MIKICHITSVHPRTDTRVYFKELISLKKHFEDVSFIVADGLGDDISKEGIKIFDVGKPTNRIKRYLFTSKAVLKKAISIDADVYHFHDPELLSVGNRIVALGKLVIYDVHEDLPRQILTKEYIPKFLRKIVSRLVERHENRKVKNISYVITATDFILKRFQKYNPNLVTIKNYPIIETMLQNIDWSTKANKLCYIGALSPVRGIREMVDVMEFVDADLNLVGSFDTESFYNQVKESSGWNKVIEHGYLPRDKAGKILAESKIGFVLLYPTVNYKDALPVKMFEYMASGIPFVITNVPLWRDIVEGSNCGICVNPFNTKEIADAINRLLNNPDLAQSMGENGKRAIVEKYNWETEEQKLISLYHKIQE